MRLLTTQFKIFFGVSMKHILLIGGHEETVLMATGMQARWSLFQKEDMISALQESVCHHVYIQNYEDLPQTIELARQLHNIDPIDVVLSFTEYGLEAAAEIKESLNIEGSPKFPIEVTRDKLKMRALLSDWERGAINYQACYSFKDFQSFFGRIKKKIILKPGKGSGSMGIATASTKEELHAAWLKTSSVETPYPYIAEEFLDGDEYSVETMSYGGRHELIAITQKITTGDPSYVEVGHQLPADLPTECEKEINDFIITFLNKIKHLTGPVHSEIRLCQDGPKLIEANTRPGGDFIWEMVAKGCGVDLVRATIEYYLSGNIRQRQIGTGAAAVRYFAFENKTVQSVDGYEKLTGLDYVVRASCQLKPGDKLGTIYSSDDRQGFIVVTGKGLRDAVANVTRAQELMKIEFIN